MKILAIDTSGMAGSMAISSDDKILGEIMINHKNSHSVMIMQMIDILLTMTYTTLDEIDYLAVTKGPGSFTGLRIGASTIKAIAHALNKKIIPISTLETLAYNIFSDDKIIIPMIDARNELVFASIYEYRESKIVSIMEERQISIKELLQIVAKNEKQPVFLGDGTSAYKDIIMCTFDQKTLAPIHLNLQRASSILALAYIYAKDEKYVDYNNLEIEYLRKPQAQREFEERNNKC